MRHHKLGFRNRPTLAQLEICERVMSNVARATGEATSNVDLSALNDAVASARASFVRVKQLEGELRAERARLAERLRAARAQATFASGMVALHLNNDPPAMLGAGLSLAAPKKPRGLPEAPARLQVLPGKGSGAVKLSWRLPMRRCVYQVQCRTDSSSADAWISRGVLPRQRTVITDLAQGTKYHFRVCAFNSHGQGPWSQVACAWVG